MKEKGVLTMIVAIAQTARVWLPRLAYPVVSAVALVTKSMGRACLLSFAVLALVGCARFPVEPMLGRAMMRPADGMVMRRVPAGAYPMGSSEAEVEHAFERCTHYWGECSRTRFHDELPQHRVALDGYWIDRTEVTNQQYHSCVQAGVCEQPACWSGAQFNDPRQPVVCVTWHQAQAYCGWVGGRLPTEAEWEYAACGPEGLRYPWGNAFVGAWLNYCDETCGRARSDPAWNDGQYYSAPVGSYPDGSSWCGALDMAGNVSEWVSDWYGRYDGHESRNPVGPAQGHLRAIRGGSWFLTPVEARTTWRAGIGPGSWFDDLGFRCVMPVSR